MKLIWIRSSEKHFKVIFFKYKANKNSFLYHIYLNYLKKKSEY